MPDILHEVVIEAEPDKVYAALTEQESLARWWTRQATAEPEVGSVDQFVFNGGRFTIKMEITELEQGKKVAWKVRQGAPHWQGTQVSWQLTPVEHGTSLLFGHLGFASTDGSFPSTSYTWATYITSLKAYLETGKGAPNAG
ncbi:MAG TPA: SRPBCC domain-containing protein [Chloroflexia bacterium]|nr:SRPBCC domain-containing protein [Chloroflexia bacterium]